MNPLTRCILAATLAAGCATTPPVSTSGPTAPQPAAPTAQQRADALLQSYLADLSARELAANTAYWAAANSGKQEDSEAFARADLALKMLHSDSARYQQIQELLQSRAELAPLTVRSLEVAELAFKGNQLPEELLGRMVNASAEIERVFKTFRPVVNGKRMTNNDLLDVLASEKDSTKRRQAWEASKAVGAEVGPKLIALARIRNEAARTLGYENYWEMQVRLQEHDPAEVLALFEQLAQATDAPFAQMKANLDGEVARRFRVKPAALMPWHYTNPFFQAAPPSEKVDLDEFFKHLKQEDIVEVAGRFFADIGLPIDAIAARSDFYEREGKDQHAFCITIDRADDVRTLLNVKPTAEWMGTMLHEMGHALYYVGIDQSLPYNLREASHIFTTEGVAMLFGGLNQNPLWLTNYAGADATRVAAVEKDILEQRRREQLIFVRWGLVMLHFERALYTNPDQENLNQTWYDLVERYQLLKRPPNRDAADWAAKPHFTIAPVYYHNYVLGELFGSQLRASLAKKAGHTGPTSSLSFNGRKDYGDFFREAIFAPGMTQRWTDFVQTATGAPLSASAFAADVK